MMSFLLWSLLYCYHFPNTPQIFSNMFYPSFHSMTSHSQTHSFTLPFILFLIPHSVRLSLLYTLFLSSSLSSQSLPSPFPSGIPLILPLSYLPSLLQCSTASFSCLHLRFIFSTTVVFPLPLKSPLRRA